MTTRTQISLDRELQMGARERASQLGISLAEYIRRLVARDLASPRPTADPSVVFALGDSGGSDIANEKDALIAAGVSVGRSRRGPKR